jgi:hypothetical protein
MQRTGGKRGALGVALALSTVFAASCSSRSTAFETSEPPTSSEPPTDSLDEGEVRDQVEIQAQEAQLLVDRLYQEPEIAADPDDAIVERLVDYHTPDSDRVDTLLDDVDELAADGHHFELHRDTNLTRTNVLVYEMAIVDQETVDFKYCTAMDVAVLDEDDEDVEDLAMLELGDGQARLVDSDWLIHRWELEDTVELNPGNVHPRECGLYGLGDDGD